MWEWGHHHIPGGRGDMGGNPPWKIDFPMPLNPEIMYYPSYHMANNHEQLYIFQGCYGYNPFRFVVSAPTEKSARRRLRKIAVNNTALEFPGCYAQNVQQIVTSKDDLSFNLPDEGKWLGNTNFSEFVTKCRVIVKPTTPVFFCSCLDGWGGDTPISPDLYGGYHPWSFCI